MNIFSDCCLHQDYGALPLERIAKYRITSGRRVVKSPFGILVSLYSVLLGAMEQKFKFLCFDFLITFNFWSVPKFHCLCQVFFAKVFLKILYQKLFFLSFKDF